MTTASALTAEFESIDPIFWQSMVPVSSCEVIRSRERAVGCARGDIVLTHDPRTGLVSNTAFDPSTQLFSPNYEETQSYSPHFSAYVRNTVQRLTDKYELAGKTVLEVGGGKGDFLIALCRQSGAFCIGIDPAYRADRHPDLSGLDISFQNTRLGSKHNDIRPDLIICRHTLEHVSNLGIFLGQIAEIMLRQPGSRLLLDVPNAERVFAEGAFWDVYYEHCHYFTASTLVRVLKDAGLEALAVYRDYDDQFLCIEARLGSGTAIRRGEEPKACITPEANYDLTVASGFAVIANAQVKAWQSWFLQRKDRRIALWGGGSKASGFLSIDGFAEAICGIADVNPYKDGSFSPGSGTKIVSPERLRDMRPDDIVIMNPVYVPEIKQRIGELGLDCTLWTLGAMPIVPAESAI